jgi:hypothetical protein
MLLNPNQAEYFHCRANIGDVQSSAGIVSEELMCHKDTDREVYDAITYP